MVYINATPYRHRCGGDLVMTNVSMTQFLRKRPPDARYLNKPKTINSFGLPLLHTMINDVNTSFKSSFQHHQALLLHGHPHNAIYTIIWRTKRQSGLRFFRYLFMSLRLFPFHFSFPFLFFFLPFTSFRFHLCFR